MEIHHCSVRHSLSIHLANRVQNRAGKEKQRIELIQKAVKDAMAAKDGFIRLARPSSRRSSHT
jgi:hypothetical protein